MDNDNALDDYQTKALFTAVYPGQGTQLGLIYTALKLTGEAGEVSEKVGKWVREGTSYEDKFFDDSSDDEQEGGGHISAFGWYEEDYPDRHALKKELGDVLWYVAAMARELGFDLSDVAQTNLDKLQSRKAAGTIHGEGDDR